MNMNSSGADFLIQDADNNESVSRFLCTSRMLSPTGSGSRGPAADSVSVRPVSHADNRRRWPLTPEVDLQRVSSGRVQLVPSSQRAEDLSQLGVMFARQPDSPGRSDYNTLWMAGNISEDQPYSTVQAAHIIPNEGKAYCAAAAAAEIIELHSSMKNMLALHCHPSIGTLIIQELMTKILGEAIFDSVCKRKIPIIVHLRIQLSQSLCLHALCKNQLRPSSVDNWIT